MTYTPGLKAVMAQQAAAAAAAQNAAAAAAQTAAATAAAQSNASKVKFIYDLNIKITLISYLYIIVTSYRGLVTRERKDYGLFIIQVFEVLLFVGFITLSTSVVLIGCY